jgi:hypothetical protein
MSDPTQMTPRELIAMGYRQGVQDEARDGLHRLDAAEIDKWAFAFADLYEPDPAPSSETATAPTPYEPDYRTILNLLDDIEGYPTTVRAVRGYIDDLRARSASRSETAEAGAQDGISLIAAERQRQIEGSPASADDELTTGQLADSAFLLINAERDWSGVPGSQALPCAFKLRVRHRGDSVRLLTIAGAFIAAELDRLSRSSRPGDPQ